MKKPAELNKLAAKKFSEYVNAKVSLRELAAFSMSKDFELLDMERRAEIQRILFESRYAETLPEDAAWELLSGSELLGVIAGSLPNPRFRKALVEVKLFGYEISLSGVVRLPDRDLSRYNKGAALRLKIGAEPGVFEFAGSPRG